MTRMDPAMDAATPSEHALARWHAVVEARDPAGLPALVAADAVFRSPPRCTRRRRGATPSWAT